MPEPTIKVVGTAKPRAHGQAITSTEIAEVKELLRFDVKTYQPINVNNERIRTVGTNIFVTLSARA